MHELSLIRSIVAIASDAAQGARVRRVAVEIGTLSGVSREALAFAFEAARQGTALEGTELDINEIEARARCATCGAEFAMATLYDACACGSHELVQLAGTELSVRSIDIEEAA